MSSTQPRGAVASGQPDTSHTTVSSLIHRFLIIFYVLINADLNVELTIYVFIISVFDRVLMFYTIA
jgi:hypothetical protein